MKNIFKYLKSYKKECILAPLFKMTEATFELLVPLVIAVIINEGIPDKDYKKIIICFLILLGFAVIGYICAIFAQYFSAKAATGFAKDVKKDIFNHIETLSYSDLDNIGTNTLITRMTSDINQMQTGVNMFLRLFMRSPFVVIGAMIMAFYVDIKMGIIFAITIPLLSIVVFSIMFGSIPLFKKIQAKLDKLLSRTSENIKGVRVIRAFRQEKNEANNFKNENNELSKFQIFVGKISALMNPLTYIIINTSIIILIYYGGIRVSDGAIKQGDVVAEYNYMSQILVELIKFAGFVITLTKAIASMKRVGEILKIENTQYFPLETKLGYNNSQYHIEFNNVSLCYKNNQENSLTNISFKVKTGEIIGIIGGTGSGKTSLVSLLPRFYDTTKGEILINGNNILNYSKNDLRKKVGIVLQKSTLFKGTIKDNLVMANPNNITDEQINEALEISMAIDVVASKKDGLNEIVLQGGKNFSGGQRQRLCIARTLLQKPEILILDDSSSALDYLTDKNLRSNLRKIKNLTTFIVSQRAISLMDADKIIVLDEGIIKEMGTHEELLENSNIYKEIYYSQTKENGGDK